MNAIIYCRVSSKDQVDGTSLESQELACREYARHNGFSVSKVFIEEGESAKFANRTQLLQLLDYCKDKTRTIEALIVWKIDRFARSVEDHFMMKATLKKLGVQIVSVTEPIKQDATGKLMEAVLAGFAQFDNDVRSMRSVQGMQQRIREGIWPWMPPLGYLPPKIGKKTQPDEPDPMRFEPIQKAWQMFATGAYAKADIVRFLQRWGVRAYRGELVPGQKIDYIFSNPYYAGVLRDPWSGNEYKGRHKPMVTAAEFARVQEIIATRNNSQPHHRLTDTFPLRGVVRCPSCEAYMTGYFAQGRSQRYPYYKCFRHSCSTRSKSYSAAVVHEEFATFLSDLSTPQYLETTLVSALLSVDLEQTEQVRQADSRAKDDAARVKSELKELLSMRAAKLISDSEFIDQRNHLRNKLSVLEGEAPDSTPQLSPNEAKELSNALSDLDSIWRSTQKEAQRGFGELVLPAGYVFQKVRTAEKGLLFCTSMPSEHPESYLVRQGKNNLNQLFREIRKLLEIIRFSKETKKEAA
jgi:DNA invertase Pin-like site-specific DNA recombinase